MAPSFLKVSRSQILGFRRRVGALDERLPATAKSLRTAAWAGLQDSMPRAALLSLHARVNNTRHVTWEHASLVQLWGPRYSAYVVAARDLAVFSLGRLPDDARGTTRAQDTATRLHAHLNGRRMPFGQAGREMRVIPNSLRYGAPTGRLLMRWNGATQPIVWTTPAPRMDTARARFELARRYLHVFGPATSASFAKWAGIRPQAAHAGWEGLGNELLKVRTPIGDAWILARDEPMLRAKPCDAAAARLLPSGDTYYLYWGADRALLVSDPKQRAALWTSRVWPGALLIRGEISGVWRRAAGEVSIEPWSRLSRPERDTAEAEALSLPLPALDGAIVVRWL